MTTATTSPQSDIDHAVARGGVYALLAGSFAYPTPEGRDGLRRTVVPVVAATGTDDAALDLLLAQALAVQDVADRELAAAHGRQFTHIESQDCPPYETAYGSRDIFRQSQVMADVAGFYRAHGLRTGGDERERPDHIATELEFMGFMARKEAMALDRLGPDEVDECRRTQAHFLEGHLAGWAPSLGRRMQAAAVHPFFEAMGGLLAHWVDWDGAGFGVEPDTVLDDPSPLPPPDDGSCGVDAAPYTEAPVDIRGGRR
jgi:DMSO reductase family type II enzyme chaperone